MKKYLLLAALALGVTACQKFESNPVATPEEEVLPSTAVYGGYPGGVHSMACGYIDNNNTLQNCGPCLSNHDIGACGCWRVGNPIPIPGQPDPGMSCRALWLDFVFGSVPRGVNIVANINEGTTITPKIDTTFLNVFVRDYLYHFKKGQEYINHFMAVSNVLFNEKTDSSTFEMDSITAEIIRDAINKTIPVAARLMAGSDNTIVIDNEYRSDMLWLIDSLHTYNPLDQSFHAGLDSFKSDLNKFAGKTRAYIYNYYDPLVIVP